MPLAAASGVSSDAATMARKRNWSMPGLIGRSRSFLTMRIQELANGRIYELTNCNT